MSYTSRERFNYEWYKPSDTELIVSSTQESTLNNVYTKLMEFKLQNDINPNSLFRYKFQMSCGNTGNGRIYINDVAVGTEQTRSGAMQEFVEDIIYTGWKRGDKIQVYAKTNGVAVQIQGFKLCGDVSKWEQTIP